MMAAGIGAIGSNHSFGKGTLGEECPHCSHKHDWEQAGNQRVIFDCKECSCLSEEFIEAFNFQSNRN